MRYLVISDVHSYFRYLEQALENAHYDPASDIIISCGDLMDRGSYPYQCLQFVNDNLINDRMICVCGNHEDLLDEAIHRREFYAHDLSNGTAQTVFDLYESYEERQVPSNTDDACIFLQRFQPYRNYRESLLNYYETDKFIFVHGWMPCKSSDNNNRYYSKGSHYTFDENWRTGNWAQARWLNGMDMWNQGIKVDGKTIVCGHWHSSWGHHYIHKMGPEFNNPYSTNPEHNRGAHFEPFVDDGIVALDGCTAYSHRVNVMIINEDNSVEYTSNLEGLYD